MPAQAITSEAFDAMAAEPATMDSAAIDPVDPNPDPAFIESPAGELAAIASAAGPGSGQLSTRVRKTPRRLSLWVVPLAVLVALLGSTYALWRAEMSLELHDLDLVRLAHRGSAWVLWGGLAISLVISGFVYVTMLRRARDHEQTRRHLRALESIQQISSTMIARIDAGSGALTDLCEAARMLMNADRSGIQILSASGGRLEMLAFAGDMPPEPPRFYELSDLPNARWCLETGRVLFAEDVRRLDRPQNHEILALFRVRSMVLIPLVIRGQQIGLMTLSSSTPQVFTDVDRRLAALLGAQAAVILANGRLYQAQQSAVRKYKALLDQRELLFSTNAAIFQMGDMDESLRRVAELAPLALGVDLCVVALGARSPNNVRVAAITPGAGVRSLRIGSTFYCPAAERAFQRGAICVFGNAATDPDVALVREGFPEMGSMACVPLSGRDGARIGVLTLIRRQAGVFSAEQLKMARLFSTRAAAAIENARLYQETRRALEEQKNLTAQRDTLWSVNAAVYRAGTLDESLERIVRLAPPALGVDLCAVDLMGNRPDEVYPAAITGNIGRDVIGLPIVVKGLKAGRALATREPLVVEDARDDAEIPAAFRERFNIGSVAYFPLSRNDGQPLGLLVLIRHQAGAFDKARLEIARVFATRAASAIENAQLLEQTRRDAATKAMLLRELNHRVKNNLAGIVALLSLGRPEMPPGIGRWLDRATDRVRVMAGAHQLFVGDAEAVSLSNLVERMLASLSVTRSAGVDMRVELGTAPAVLLRTEQAISLAMALHELCYNAIVHGLGGGGGTVTLRTRDAGAGRLAVDVIDTGRGAPGSEPEGQGDGRESAADDGHHLASNNGPQSASGPGSDSAMGSGRASVVGSGDDSAAGNEHAAATGIGLEIVRGLVSRELRGRFSIATAPGGGTVATVEFPLQGVHHERDASCQM